MINSRRDYLVLLTARSLRAFGFGFGAVLIGIHLDRKGFPPVVVGTVLSVGLGAAALYGLVLARWSAPIGRRRGLALTGLLMGLAGLDLALATSAWEAVLAGLTGMVASAGSDYGPFSALEQAVLTGSVPSQRRNRAFGRYALFGALATAAGGLAATAGTTPARTELFFAGYGLLGLATTALALALSPAVEATDATATGLPLNRRLVGLSSLFLVDSIGGGLVAQAVIAYWLHVRFGASAQLLGPLFAVMSLLQAGSYEVAGRLGDRIGLVNTMVFTHLPSNLLLALVPLSPTLPAAIGLLLVRFSISQMDVPARQAYVVSIVPAGQRAGALAVTGTVRGAGQALGPYVAGVAIQAAAYGVPFVLAGALKAAYDLALFGAFRRVRGEHEVTSA
ncbi:MAG TPA: MFS transporter [Candidatus Dormibacteraeota bacterium]